MKIKKHKSKNMFDDLFDNNITVKYKYLGNDLHIKIG